MQQDIDDFAGGRVQAPDRVVSHIGQHEQRRIIAVVRSGKYLPQVGNRDFPDQRILGDVVDIIPVNEEFMADHFAIKADNKNKYRGAVYAVGMSIVAGYYPVPDSKESLFHNLSVQLELARACSTQLKVSPNISAFSMLKWFQNSGKR